MWHVYLFSVVGCLVAALLASGLIHRVCVTTWSVQLFLLHAVCPFQLVISMPLPPNSVGKDTVFSGCSSTMFVCLSIHKSEQILLPRYFINSYVCHGRVYADIYLPIFTPSVQDGVQDPENWKFYPFSKYKRPAECSTAPAISMKLFSLIFRYSTVNFWSMCTWIRASFITDLF